MTVFLIAMVIVIGLFLWGAHAYGEEKLIGANPIFKRINDVVGELSTDNEKIPTYNGGYLTINDHVEIHFYNNSSSVTITDIIYNRQSIFSYGMASKPYREKADFALQSLKRSANYGYIPMNTVSEVEDIILRVDDLNKYLKEGKIRILSNNDFAWA